MKYLSTEGFSRARQFLRTRARPLERAIFAYRFESGSPEAAVAELARFQNDDGGFGRAVEPDLRTPASSALGTATALRTLKQLGVTADHQLVRSAVAYLLRTFDDTTRTWRIVPPEANLSPHAPWWHDEDGSIARAFGNFEVNPRGEIVGLLHHFSADVPGAWLGEVTETTVACIESRELDWHGLLNALALAETAALPDHFRRRLRPPITDATERLIRRDPAQWATYGGLPMIVAPNPDSLVAHQVREALQENLDYAIEHQGPDGAWSPNWSWGDLYPETWPVAKQEWQGIITLDTLTSLRAFGRIAGIDPTV